jgi:hypothetical protein
MSKKYNYDEVTIIYNEQEVLIKGIYTPFKKSNDSYIPNDQADFETQEIIYKEIDIMSVLDFGQIEILTNMTLETIKNNEL